MYYSYFVTLCDDDLGEYLVMESRKKAGENQTFVFRTSVFYGAFITFVEFALFHNGSLVLCFMKPPDTWMLCNIDCEPIVVL